MGFLTLVRDFWGISGRFVMIIGMIKEVILLRKINLQV
jgi:hypothetical protein